MTKHRKSCWQCGKPLVQAISRKPVVGVERELPSGEKVRLHQVCSRTFDEDWQHLHITAQPKA